MSFCLFLSCLFVLRQKGQVQVRIWDGKEESKGGLLKKDPEKQLLQSPDLAFSEV